MIRQVKFKYALPLFKNYTNLTLLTEQSKPAIFSRLPLFAKTNPVVEFLHFGCE
jgi:hypothetical protein